MFDKTYAMHMLKGLKRTRLVRILRAAQMARLHFACVSDVDHSMVLHIQHAYRLVNTDKIVLALSDVYQPNSVYCADQDFDYDSFAWDEVGNNRFDEIVESDLLPRLNEDNFIVNDIELSNFGDLKISFGNGYSLEVFIDTSGEKECWRFMDLINIDTHLVVTGVGIEMN